MKDEEYLNKAIPASSLIKTLAQQRRDLEFENLELKREIEVLKEDNQALKEYCAEAHYGSGTKDIAKICNVLTNLLAQCGKKLGPIEELISKMDELKETIEEFANKVEEHEL